MPKESTFAFLPHRPYVDLQTFKNPKDTFGESVSSSFKSRKYRYIPETAMLKDKNGRIWHSNAFSF